MNKIKEDLDAKVLESLEPKSKEKGGILQYKIEIDSEALEGLLKAMHKMQVQNAKSIN